MFKKFCALLISIFIFSPSAIGADQIDDVSKSLFKIQVEQAKKGNAHDQFAVGEMFEKGLGTPRDLTKAHLWYKKSADQGFKEARRKLEKWAEARAAEERARNMARQQEQRRLQQEAARRQAKDQRRAAAAAKKAKNKGQPKRKKKKVAKKAPPVAPVSDKKQEEVEKTTTADNKATGKSEKEVKDKDKKKSKRFSVNPCEGETAKFLTTCRK